MTTSKLSGPSVDFSLRLEDNTMIKVTPALQTFCRVDAPASGLERCATAVFELELEGPWAAIQNNRANSGHEPVQ